jgi:hypothetical protein
MAIPFDSDMLLGRREGAGALSEAGYRTAPATLATLASRGGGPVYQRYGSRAVYRWGDLLDWARSRLSAPMRSTSEADAAMPPAKITTRRDQRPDPAIARDHSASSPARATAR